MTKNLKLMKGVDCNKVNIGGITELYGDPNIKIEKPYTIVGFPGGSVEISRTTDGEYWVHVATHQNTPEDMPGRIVDARVDADRRYCDATNRAIRDEIAKGGVNHIAFRVSSGGKM